jgi:predicted acyl esterase
MTKLLMVWQMVLAIRSATKSSVNFSSCATLSALPQPSISWSSRHRVVWTDICQQPDNSNAKYWRGAAAWGQEEEPAQPTLRRPGLGWTETSPSSEDQVTSYLYKGWRGEVEKDPIGSRRNGGSLSPPGSGSRSRIPVLPPCNRSCNLSHWIELVATYLS